MKISIIGLGYIGLPTAAILASRNIEVIGVDVSLNVVKTINRGEIHIMEDGLRTLVSKAVQAGNLRAVLEPESADVFIVAVPTPIKESFEPDLSYIKSASKAIAPVLKKNDIVILESTSPVGTTEKMMEWMRELRPDLNFPVFGDSGIDVDISFAHCPERVLPGQVLRELVENDRIIGGITRQCAKKAKEIYKIFVKADCLLTDSRTAELSKLVENSYRDVNIAFANELSLICDKLKIDVWKLIQLANRHPRVDILQPGPGVGGHCIAVDPWFIIDSAEDEAKLIRTARMVNDYKPDFVLEKVNQAVSNTGQDKAKLNIACLGLAFKANIDDLRESPAMKIAKKIELMGFSNLLLVEPNIDKLPNEFNDNYTKLVELDEALVRADLVLLLVDHLNFKEIDSELLLNKQVIDTKGIW